MTINYRRGFRRILIALGVPWVVLWSLYGWVSYRAIQTHDAALRISLQVNDDLGTTMHEQAIERAQHGFALAIYWGAAIPIICAILVAILWWIYRGFRPKVLKSGSAMSAGPSPRD